MINIEETKNSFLFEIKSVKDSKSFEELKIKYLGRKGVVTSAFKELAELPIEEKKNAGKVLNEFKNFIQSILDENAGRFTMEHISEEFFDITLPGRQLFIGKKHPLMLVLDEIKDIFKNMGFVVASGPEVETDYYNFEALNIPKDHPARDMQDTFYIDDEIVLRTHTSPVQIRTMESRKPPIRIICPGRVYRRDAFDATHSPIFHQVEGLVVDEGISMSDLKAVLLVFAQKLFGKNTRVRFKPSFFPFTEPSADLYATCPSCKGEKCRKCKFSGWLEICGAGMVNPALYKFVDYDPEKYTGYAFGMGVERIAMVKFGIDEIRLFYENDIRFIHQF
jgi:phenylalanyl-tRNA synthetase alpha chain